MHLRLKKNKDFIIACSGILFYRIALDFNYYFVLNPEYEYAGFANQVNVNTLLVSYLILVPFIVLAGKNIIKIEICSNLVSILTLCSFVPFSSMSAFIVLPSKLIIMEVCYFAMMYIYLALIPNFRIKLPNQKLQVSNIVIAYFIISIIYIWIVYAHGRVNFNLLNVYEFRDESNSYNLPTIMEYSFSCAKTVLPVLMAYMFYMNRKMISIIIMMSLIIIFFIDGSKSVFFTTIVSIIAINIYDIKYNKYAPLALCIIVSCSIIEKSILGSQWINAFIIRRVLYLPNLLNSYYYDFFSTHNFDYFHQSFLELLGAKSEYNAPLKEIIGGIYFNNLGASPNNGLISDAYSNLGFMGAIVMPLLVIIAFKVLHSVSYHIPYEIIIVLILTVSLAFISSSFFTVMLTHGFVALCIVLWVLPKSNKKMYISK